jgi:hypothetical protein
MSSSLPKSLSFLVLCLLTQGCVGLAGFSVKTKTFQDPWIANAACAESVTLRGDSQTNTLTYTAAWLDAHWGKPKTIKRTGKGNLEDVWIYKFDTTWSGVMPVVVIPIPILIPTGREQVLFTMRDGNVISAKVRKSYSTGGGYGCYAGICGPHFGAFSMND